MDWQPIESAPKDGRNLLLWEPGQGTYLGSRDSDDDQWWTDEDWANDYERRFPPVCSPTHWMPLPDPPK